MNRLALQIDPGDIGLDTGTGKQDAIGQFSHIASFRQLAYYFAERMHIVIVRPVARTRCRPSFSPQKLHAVTPHSCISRSHCLSMLHFLGNAFTKSINGLNPRYSFGKYDDLSSPIRLLSLSLMFTTSWNREKPRTNSLTQS